MEIQTYTQMQVCVITIPLHTPHPHPQWYQLYVLVYFGVIIHCLALPKQGQIAHEGSIPVWDTIEEKSYRYLKDLNNKENKITNITLSPT